MVLLLESATETISGIGVSSFCLAVAVGVLYRLFAGRFLIPKREIVLPDQQGVLTYKDKQIRLVGPGGCWVRPGQRLLLCDVRPKSLQLSRFEIATSDRAVVILSLNAEYRNVDPMKYLRASGNPGDALIFALRRIVVEEARCHIASEVITGNSLFTAEVRERLDKAALNLGFEVLSLELWECALQYWMDPAVGKEVSTVLN